MRLSMAMHHCKHTGSTEEDHTSHLLLGTETSLWEFHFFFYLRDIGGAESTPGWRKNASRLSRVIGIRRSYAPLPLLTSDLFMQRHSV